MLPERLPNPDRSADRLEARLRALTPPTVPADLEARLVAALPPDRPTPRRRRHVWAGVAAVAAAACLVAVLAWQTRGDKERNPSWPPKAVARQVPPLSADERPNFTTLPLARRLEDAAEPPSFTWPLAETSPARPWTAIPADLLD
jgi:hypothetical protein